MYLTFKAQGLDLIDFQLYIRKEGADQIRVTLKQGFHETYLIFETIFESNEIFVEG